MDLTNAILIEV